MHATTRRSFLASTLFTAAGFMLGLAQRVFGAAAQERDIFAFIIERRGSFDITLYRQLLGHASEYKEGDEAIGVAAPDDAARVAARALLGNTRIADLLGYPVHEDEISRYANAAVDTATLRGIADWKMSQLKAFLLESDEPAIRRIMTGLASDIIAHVVKLMSNDELISVSRKIFNPLPGSQIGARGYMGARIQPNSPTDDPQDIAWQVFNGFSFAVGDVVLGTNPVSSEPASVAAIEFALKDILVTFGIDDVMPHCVLSHIDVQAAVEATQPGSTAIWFQSLAGVDPAAATFDISVAKMRAHARARRSRYGLYFETGQGADQTNGHGLGFDMLMHESREYGFARALAKDVAAARGGEPWVHLNDVAGFIGPEVFRSKEQLVRCCLEDTVMGKLHGLTIGLDICSTLHMDVTLDDLDWCIDQVMPANPAYLMALPTKNDPMLSYLTTSFQDHVRIREKFGYRVNDAMWSFFQQLGVIDERGRATSHFGDPSWVYLQYRRRKHDSRSDDVILTEAREQIAAVRARGVLIAEGHGLLRSQHAPALDAEVRRLYEDSRMCLRAELPWAFAGTIHGGIAIATSSVDRNDYILHPPSGELLPDGAIAVLQRIRAGRGDDVDVQVVISDGLNPLALTDEGHLAPFLDTLRASLGSAGLHTAAETIVVRHGRVRAGYRIGEALFAGGEPGRKRAILHVIGERPGSGHHAFSVYITAPPASTWATPGMADHNITRVVSGVADTQLAPARAATETVAILRQLLDS